MFEHIYGHSAVIEQLRKDVERKVLPHAILLNGERYRGRMTVALEVSRALRCRKQAILGCSCASCQQGELLGQPHLLILSDRDFGPEIHAAEDCLRRCRNSASLRLFIRTIRTMIGRYHPVFFEGYPASRAGEFDKAAEIDDELNLLSSRLTDPEDPQVLKQVSTIVKKAISLAPACSKAVPAAAVRMISTWIHQTSEPTARSIIIEGIDTFNDAAINSLLKILEEPPEQVYFILLASNRTRILPTIASRVRMYYLGKREEQEGHVIEQVYCDNSQEYDCLATFFSVKDGVDCRLLRSQAEDFLFTALSRRVLARGVLESQIDAVCKAGQAGQFILELVAVLQDEYSEGFIRHELSMSILEAITAASTQRETYNQGDALVLQSLYLTIGQIGL